VDISTEYTGFAVCRADIPFHSHFFSLLFPCSPLQRCLRIISSSTVQYPSACQFHDKCAENGHVQYNKTNTICVPQTIMAFSKQQLKKDRHSRLHNILLIRKMKSNRHCRLDQLKVIVGYCIFHSFHSIYLKISPQGTIDTHSKQHKNTFVVELTCRRIFTVPLLFYDKFGKRGPIFQ